jgi:hypothetical protein
MGAFGALTGSRGGADVRAMMREDIEITTNFAYAGVRIGTIEAKFQGARAPGTPAIDP